MGSDMHRVLRHFSILQNSFTAVKKKKIPYAPRIMLFKMGLHVVNKREEGQL